MSERMKKGRFIAGLCFILLATPVFSWNAVGHRMIAQIAVNHLTPQAYVRFNAYNHALDRRDRPQTLVSAAVWLDTFHRRGSRNWDPMHYLDIPFSDDGSPLPEQTGMNAVLAIREARQTLLNQQASLHERAIAVRILLHVVGDLHQPLHAATCVSKLYPEGDRGGNLSRLPTNPVSTNLHTYWDRGAGFLAHRVRAEAMKKKAASLETRWPCVLDKMNTDPMHWAKESHALAVKYAYAPQRDQGVYPRYQRMAVQVVEERLALAGCRLAAVLNDLDSVRSLK